MDPSPLQTKKNQFLCSFIPVSNPMPFRGLEVLKSQREREKFVMISQSRLCLTVVATRLLVYVFNLGHLQQWNFAQYHTLFCQSRCKMLPKLNKPSKYCQSLFNFYQSGKISPNLVTLVTCVRRWKLTYIRKSVGLLFGFRWFA